MSYQAITNAKIVTSKEIVEGAIVFGEDGRIAETGANVDWTRYAVDQVYDAGGAYALPGGIDAHVHLGVLVKLRLRMIFTMAPVRRSQEERQP